MNPLTPQQEEEAARAMRDALMEQTTTDNNWEACKGHYLRHFGTFQRRLQELGLVIKTINPKGTEKARTA